MFTGTFVGDELENSKSGWDAYEKGADAVAFRRIYAEMAGTALAGLLLSQTVYWHKPSKETGKPKLRVFRDGNYWLAKSFPAWWDECCATPNEARGAIKVLSNSRKLKHGVLAGVERLPLIEVAKWKFGSKGRAAPTTHIRIIWENFLPLFEKTKRRLEEEARSVKFTERSVKFPKRSVESTDPLTETTSKTTPEITSSLLREERQILENEFGGLLSKAGAPASVIQEVRGTLGMDHARAAIFLTGANANGNRPAYLTKVLRSWSNFPEEAADGLKQARSVWLCGKCETVNRRATLCKECRAQREDAGTWAIPRET